LKSNTKNIRKNLEVWRKHDLACLNQFLNYTKFQKNDLQENGVKIVRKLEVQREKWNYVDYKLILNNMEFKKMYHTKGCRIAIALKIISFLDHYDNYLTTTTKNTKQRRIYMLRP
jgi:hypothetical protein